MMGTEKIYIGSHQVIDAISYEHAYLIYDPDTDGDNNISTGSGMQILRGGPSSQYALFPINNLFVEAYELASESADADNLISDSIGFRLIESGSAASVDWIKMRNFALSIGDATGDDGLRDTKLTYLSLPNSNTVVNSLLSLIGKDFAVNTPYGAGVPNDIDLYLGHNGIIDSSGNDFFKIFASADDYIFFDGSGADTISVENGARLNIVKDTNPAHTGTNDVVLQNVSSEALSLGVLYTVGLGSNPVFSDNFGVIKKGDAFLNSLSNPILRVDGQYASGGRGIDVIEIRDGGNSLIKTINLAAVGKEDFGTLGLKLSDIFTAYTAHEDVTGDNSADYIYGDVAANILRGEWEDDVIRGGAGTDTYAFSFGDGNDTLIDDWAEGDTIALDFAVTREMISTSISGSDLIVTIGGVGSLTIKDMAASAATFVTDHIDNVIYEATTAVPSTGPVQWGTPVLNPSTGLYEQQDLNDTLDGYEFSNDHLYGDANNNTINLLVPVNDNALSARPKAAA